jgi:dienelactone hydrolase
MPVTANTTIMDADHFVTLVQNGQTITQPRNLPLNIYAPDTPGAYPVIVLSHGHFGGPTFGAGATATALAARGYIVIVPTHLDSSAYPAEIRDQFPVELAASTLHRIADLTFALDQAQALTALLPPGYSADLAHVTVAGHSHGAFTASIMAGVQSNLPGLTVAPVNSYGLAGLTDPRFDAAILLSPQGLQTNWTQLTAQSWNNLLIPILTITGTQDSQPGDSTTTWETRLDILRNAPSGVLFGAVYEGATHNQLGGFGAPAALTASVAQVADLFIEGVVLANASSLALINNPASLTGAESLLRAAFERGGVGLGGIAGGSGFVRGATPGEYFGLQGADTIIASSGADTLLGDAGNDTLSGGAGADVLDGGAGVDTADYSTSQLGVIVSLASGTGQGGEAQGDTLTGIENLNGGAGADALIGNTTANILIGNAGADILDGLKRACAENAIPPARPAQAPARPRQPRETPQTIAARRDGARQWRPEGRSTQHRAAAPPPRRADAPFA